MLVTYIVHVCSINSSIKEQLTTKVTKIYSPSVHVYTNPLHPYLPNPTKTRSKPQTLQNRRNCTIYPQQIIKSQKIKKKKKPILTRECFFGGRKEREAPTDGCETWFATS
ncbi:hypothetical protein ACJW31_12G092800 [Castanea mollissima]